MQSIKTRTGLEYSPVNVRYAVVPAAPTILIVDDVPTNLLLLGAILGKEGFRVLKAQDGPSARETLSREPADLVLLDVMMPRESGFDTCAQMKSNPLTADIPVIFLSALDDGPSKVTGLRCGAVDYIAKPFHKDEVLARVRVHLQIRQNSRLLAQQNQDRIEQFRDAQRAILTRPDDCPQAAFSVYYRPLEETGGDFYEVLPIDSDMFGYFVADISGHGISAAFLTAAIKALLRQYAGPLYSPEETMRGVDSVMRQMLGEEQYLTACYARLHRPSGHLAVVSAGHPPLIVVSASGTTQVLDASGDPLGIFSSAVLQRKDLWLCRRDRIFLYSDGMIEASAGGGRQFGVARLAESCVRHRSLPLSEAVQAIANEVRPETQAADDDLVLLATEVTE
jgi:sigma-B regulation protein RsbU (phosphoserine phosphatase)